MRWTLVVVALVIQFGACSDDGRDGGGATSADVTPPSTPSGLVAKVLHPTELRLSWIVSIDSGAGVAGYNVYRDGVRIASTVETSYQDDDVEPGQRYAYSISSYDRAVPTNESAQASPVTVAMTYVIQDLCAMSGSPGLSAVDLNNSGMVLASGDGEGVGDLFRYRWVIYRDASVTAFLDSSLPIAMNESGDVIAIDSHLDDSVPGGVARNGLLYRAGTFTDLGTLGGHETWPRDLNDRGQIVGYSADGNGQRHAFLWQDGLLADIGLTDAFSINNAGQVVGTALPTGSDFGVIVRLTNQVPTTVGECWSPDVPRDVSWVSFMKINEAGQILCRADGAFTIPNPGGIPGFMIVSSASFVDGTTEYFGLPSDDMNEGGQLVGDGVVYWQGVTTDIPQLPGCSFGGRMLRVNTPGQIVGGAGGSVGDTPCEDTAILVAKGQTWDLNDLIDEAEPLGDSVTLQVGSFINYSGDIVAGGRDSLGSYCGAYLLTLKGADAKQ